MRTKPRKGSKTEQAIAYIQAKRSARTKEIATYLGVSPQYVTTLLRPYVGSVLVTCTVEVPGEHAQTEYRISAASTGRLLPIPADEKHVQHSDTPFERTICITRNEIDEHVENHVQAFSPLVRTPKPIRPDAGKKVEPAPVQPDTGKRPEPAPAHAPAIAFAPAPDDRHLDTTEEDRRRAALVGFTCALYGDGRLMLLRDGARLELTREEVETVAALLTGRVFQRSEVRA